MPSACETIALEPSGAPEIGRTSSERSSVSRKLASFEKRIDALLRDFNALSETDLTEDDRLRWPASPCSPGSSWNQCCKLLGMAPTPVVFISSTAEDLKAYRAAARDAAISAGFLPKMMEYFAASGARPPLEACMATVSEADVLVVIVAHRYGWVPPDQAGVKSITWLECEHAKEVLAFVVDKDHDWPVDLREAYRLTEAAEAGKYTPELAGEINRNVAKLREFRQWLESRGIRAAFTNPEDLRGKVESALREWRDRHPRFAPIAAPAGDPRRYLAALREQTAWMPAVRTTR